LPTFRVEVPAGVTINVMYDRSKTPSANRSRTLRFSLILALALVVMVIFIFLRNIPATTIPAVALPMWHHRHVLADVPVRLQPGQHLTDALTLCVGFVVDDAIVMLENISRHIEMGKSPLQATLDGSKEVSSPSLRWTISLVAVFIPVLFMGGILGRLLHEFAVTIIVAVLLSGLSRSR